MQYATGKKGSKNKKKLEKAMKVLKVRSVLEAAVGIFRVWSVHGVCLLRF